ncbi:MAG: hypothetical protein HDS96_00315 [Bacteroidales bacterium]|nr:hypothetical protein [Bacteroidales bacterium]
MKLVSIIKPLLLAAMALTVMKGYSQMSLRSSGIDNMDFQYQINSIDEFIGRFNDAVDKGCNKSALGNLFDVPTIADNQDLLIESAENFIEKIADSKPKLGFADKDWFAFVECVGSLKGKEVSFNLYLTVEALDNGVTKWVISHADGELFELTPNKQAGPLSISPTDHELNFMSLIEITNKQKSEIVQLLAATNPLNQASVFCSMIYYGLLKLTRIKNITFQFFQVPDYVFSVRNFPREGSNAGWLISEWSKASNADKNAIFSYLRPHPHLKPLTTAGDADKLRPVQLDADSAVKIVQDFVTDINTFFHTRQSSQLEIIRQKISGAYLFTADGCKILAVGKPDTLYGGTHWQQLLKGILNPDFKGKHCRVNNLEVETDSIITKQGKFTVVSCELMVDGVQNLSEPVLFYLHGDKIAGIRPKNWIK